MLEATCSKCGDIYNPEQLEELHLANGCEGSPINQVQYDQTGGK